jgi:hypothetical protein
MSDDGTHLGTSDQQCKGETDREFQMPRLRENPQLRLLVKRNFHTCKELFLHAKVSIYLEHVP